MKRLVRVAGKSMAPTYRSSDLLITRPVGRAGARVRRGDVVVFRHDGLRMVKRVVGLPGDLVELEAGRLFVNGESVDGRPRVHGAYTQTWRVPGTNYFMAGDNPAVSDDSRVWDEPFAPAAGLEAVVTRRLAWPRRPGGLTPRRPAAATGRDA
ncbi:signal peptidase [Actinotalea ferrariae CF5-4]|uniref:Signal peptidase I n=1 Tax=Actinotalea ferrariae CF5-4 TaxID=948458 RepID=A0A021VVY0_9CELL|nr:signal peptidase I [Actinotalea ferrariae]EYR65278.1 signal peptidase [Actinotalea ferrariae CF5-4]